MRTTPSLLSEVQSTRALGTERVLRDIFLNLQRRSGVCKLYKSGRERLKFRRSCKSQAAILLSVPWKLRVAPAEALGTDLGYSCSKTRCLLEKGHCVLLQIEEKELCIFSGTH